MAPGARRGCDSPGRGGGGRYSVPDLLRGVPRDRGRCERTGLVPDRRAVPPHRTGPRVLGRIHLQHHPVRPRCHAALWRQGVSAQRPMGDRQSRAQASGTGSPRARAGRRGRRHSPGAQRYRFDRREAPMSPTLRERLVQRALAGRYDLFLGLGGGMTVLGTILIVMAGSAGQGVRVWQMFHVNWLYFTGLAAGSVAFVAVQKVANAKWSGMIIRFASASAAFLPVSLLGLVLIFTAGYPAIYGPMVGQLHSLQHGKAVWLAFPF